MSERARPPNRRKSENFEIEAQGLSFTATVSRGVDGTVQEIFLTNHRAGSDAGIKGISEGRINNIWSNGKLQLFMYLLKNNVEVINRERWRKLIEDFLPH